MNKKTIYRQSFETAVQNGETALYHASNEQNRACAEAIDKAIEKNHYSMYHYDTKIAAQDVIAQYGPDRLTWVLSAIFQRGNDARISRENVEWTRQAAVPQDIGRYLVIHSHPMVLDSFIRNAREIMAALEKLRLDERSLLFSDVELTDDRNKAITFPAGGVIDTHNLNFLGSYQEFTSELPAGSEITVTVNSWSVGLGESDFATDEEAALIADSREYLDRKYGIDHIQAEHFTEQMSEDGLDFDDEETDEELEP